MMAAVVARAPAKVNLTLEVTGRLPSGYHELRSLFVRLDDAADTIELRIAAGQSGVCVTSDSRDIPTDATNICHESATRFLTAIACAARVDIHIVKAIPVAAGLGGGSSDAATVLLALNEHFGCPIDAARLAALGAGVGKDIPFFLRRVPAAIVTGAGEGIQPLSAFPRMRFLLVNPGIAVSTSEAFASLAADVWYMSDTTRVDITARMAAAIRSGDRAAIAASLYNEFEATVERRHPIIKEIKQAMMAFGATGALMSGSGPTVFGLFDSDATRLAAAMALRQRYPSFVVLDA